jgi:hypothetical protein
VLGAFRAIPIRQLETKAYVPPLDLWLNGRTARDPSSRTEAVGRKMVRGPIEQWDERERQRVLADWTARWTRDQRKQERVVRPGTDPDNCQAVPEDTPPCKLILKLHFGKQRAQCLYRPRRVELDLQSSSTTRGCQESSLQLNR